MAKMTRRSMLWATSTGVAALAGVTALVVGKQEQSAKAAGATTEVAASGVTITAFVKDASTGMISVFQGESETVVHAPDMVQALLNMVK